MYNFAEIDKKYTRIDPPRPLGHYQCYCKEFSSYSQVALKDDDLCYQFYRDIGVATAEKYLVAIVIIIMNIILRTICIKLTESVGYEQKSIVLGRITIFVTIVQFVNNGVIIALSTANYTHTVFKWTGLNNGPYTDFNQDWYDNVGFMIVLTIIFSNAVSWLWHGIFFLKRYITKQTD